MATATEQVAAIADAIAVILAGGVSSYTIGGVAVTRLDLGKLRDLRRYYASLARSSEARSPLSSSVSAALAAPSRSVSVSSSTRPLSASLSAGRWAGVFCLSLSFAGFFPANSLTRLIRSG